MYKNIVLLGFFCLFSINALWAQEDRLPYNPLSSVPQFLMTECSLKEFLWYRVDLKEKQNRPFFAREREISRLIIQAVKSDLLIPYVNDSVNTPMTKNEFIENIKIPRRRRRAD